MIVDDASAKASMFRHELGIGSWGGANPASCKPLICAVGFQFVENEIEEKGLLRLMN